MVNRSALPSNLNASAKAPSDMAAQAEANAGPTSSEVTEELKSLNMVRELTEAQSLFKVGDYGECQKRCYEILIGRTAEAVQAKTHMLLCRTFTAGGSPESWPYQ